MAGKSSRFSGFQALSCLKYSYIKLLNGGLSLNILVERKKSKCSCCYFRSIPVNKLWSKERKVVGLPNRFG